MDVDASRDYARHAARITKDRYVTQSSIKRDQNLQINMQIPAHFTELSILMSEVLNDSGAGKDTVMERRETYLWRERMETIGNQLSGQNVECFYFGSQSEGTTTPGLQSDVDFLISQNYVNIMRVWGDWEAGMLNRLMLHDDSNPPQQYLLQVIRPDTPEPVISICDDLYVRKDTGQVLWSTERLKTKIEIRNKDLGEANKNGPSMSWVPNWDFVFACHVRRPLPEIQHWIDRCRGRHWPYIELLEAARATSCFLVPAGNPDSDYKHEEWRLSPNLIERMLMFSLNMTQIKCYIALKLIKKSLFPKIVGDSITSFHCKTIMFFTLESTHPSLWFEHNLMFLLLLCLHVLRKFLRLGRLPHYIIEGVNLFDGKLSVGQQRRLIVYIDSMLRNNLQDVFYIGIDKIGCRLQTCNIRRIGQAGELGRVRVRNSIGLLLKCECLQSMSYRFRMFLEKIKSFNTAFELGITYALRNVFKYSTKVRLKTFALVFIKHLYALNNSMQISKCLRLRNVINSEIINRFQYSFNTVVASSHLKLASILFCSGQLHAAVRVLKDVERRYHGKVEAVCGCRRNERAHDLQAFANMLSGNSVDGFSEPPFTLCVTFFREESYCTPFIFLFEMNRNITEEEVAQRTFHEKKWMDSAEVDARPFLHYLQYLTYGGLGERDHQLNAFREMESYIFDTRNHINLYHQETALNLQGHCYEMEGDYRGALHNYRESLRCRRTNNAANWHVRRVLRLMRG